MVCTFAQPCPNLNATTLFDYFTYANQTTSDAFGFVMLMVIFLVSFFGMRAFPLKQSLPVSLFIAAVFSLIMRLGNLVGDWVVYLMFASAIASAIILTMGKEDS